DVDLLVGQQVGGGHQLGVDRDAADVVDVAVAHRRAVDLRLQHLSLHGGSPYSLVVGGVDEPSPARGSIKTLSISRAAPTGAATATRRGRWPSSSTATSDSASRASRYSGSIPAAASSASPAASAAASEAPPRAASRTAARARERATARSRSAGSR